MLKETLGHGRRVQSRRMAKLLIQGLARDDEGPDQQQQLKDADFVTIAVCKETGLRRARLCRQS